MKNNSHQTESLYKHLGSLLYAITACDGMIRHEEYQTLRQQIKGFWQRNHIHNELILDAYNKLYLDEVKAEESFNKFIAFSNKNKTLFTKELKSQILETVGALARSVNSVNKSELILIAKLSLAFKN